MDQESRTQPEKRNSPQTASSPSGQAALSHPAAEETHPLSAWVRKEKAGQGHFSEERDFREYYRLR